MDVLLLRGLEHLHRWRRVFLNASPSRYDTTLAPQPRLLLFSSSHIANVLAQLLISSDIMSIQPNVQVVAYLVHVPFIWRYWNAS